MSFSSSSFCYLLSFFILTNVLLFFFLVPINFNQQTISTTKMSDYLPMEILQKVLLKLPIKPLWQSSSVCKTWHNLITSPDFKSQHLDYIKSHPTNIFIERYHASQNQDDIEVSKRNYVYVLYSDDKDGTFKEYTRFEFSNEKSTIPLRFAGLSNGLICLANIGAVTVRPQDYELEVVLWNPIIQKSLHLPKPNTEFGLFDEALTNPSFPIRPSHRVFGFVYDHIGNDYKVLRIHSWSGVPSIVEVFRLSTGLWEDISYKAPIDLSYYSALQVDLNGIAHWLGEDNNGKSKIITFDVHEEVFGSIGLPVNVVDMVDDGQIFGEKWKIFHQKWGKYHFVFEGSLFLIRRVNTGEVTHAEEWKFDIWKMGEYNVVESWVQVHSWVFDVPMRPLGFRKNGEILWVADNKRLISTNLVDSTSKYIREYRNGLYYSSYVESLTLLDKSLPTGADDQKVEILEEL